MYCSEECLRSHWNLGHDVSCLFTWYLQSNETIHLKLPKCIPLNAVNKEFVTEWCCLQHLLICHFGFANLKNAILKNEPMESFIDPRTKGFKDGEFNIPTLEAVLSLEDNIDKQSDKDLSNLCMVCVTALSFLSLMNLFVNLVHKFIN